MTCLPRTPELGRGASAVVTNYALRNAFIDRRDLEQEAALASLEAAHRWHPGSAPRDLWESRVVALALSRFVAEARVPVSLPKHKGENWQRAASATRAELDDDVAEHSQPLEDRLDLARATAEVRRILAAEGEAARLVLLAEERSAEVARRLGLPVREVYDQVAAAMRRLRAALVPLMEGA